MIFLFIVSAESILNYKQKCLGNQVVNPLAHHGYFSIHNLKKNCFFDFQINKNSVVFKKTNCKNIKLEIQNSNAIVTKNAKCLFRASLDLSLVSMQNSEKYNVQIKYDYVTSDPVTLYLNHEFVHISPDCKIETNNIKLFQVFDNKVDLKNKKIIECKNDLIYIFEQESIQKPMDIVKIGKLNQVPGEQIVFALPDNNFLVYLRNLNQYRVLDIFSNEVMGIKTNMGTKFGNIYISQDDLETTFFQICQKKRHLFFQVQHGNIIIHGTKKMIQNECGEILFLIM